MTGLDQGYGEPHQHLSSSFRGTGVDSPSGLPSPRGRLTVQRIAIPAGSGGGHRGPPGLATILASQPGQAGLGVQPEEVPAPNLPAQVQGCLSLPRSQWQGAGPRAAGPQAEETERGP